MTIMVISMSEGGKYYVRRKFRSQTSDNMDRWKSRGGKSHRREKRRRRSEKRKSQKKEDVGARKGRKVAKHCVLPMICCSGGSKSRLAKAAGVEPSGEMRDEKLLRVVARSTFPSQNEHNNTGALLEVVHQVFRPLPYPTSGTGVRAASSDGSVVTVAGGSCGTKLGWYQEWSTGHAVRTLQPDVSFIHLFVVSQILTDAEAMEHVPTWMHDMPRPSGLHDMPHPPNGSKLGTYVASAPQLPPWHVQDLRTFQEVTGASNSRASAMEGDSVPTLDLPPVSTGDTTQAQAMQAMVDRTAANEIALFSEVHQYRRGRRSDRPARLHESAQAASSENEPRESRRDHGSFSWRGSGVIACTSPVHCFQDLHLHVVHIHVVICLGFQSWGADRVPRLLTFSLSRKLGKVHKRVPVWLCCGMDLTCGTWNWVGNWCWLYWGVVDIWHRRWHFITSRVHPTTKPFPTTSSPFTFPLTEWVLEDFIEFRNPCWPKPARGAD